MKTLDRAAGFVWLAAAIYSAFNGRYWFTGVSLMFLWANWYFHWRKPPQ